MCASFIEWKMMASAPSKAHMEPEHDGWLWGIDDQTKMADVASRCCFHNISTGSSTPRILIEFSVFFPTFNGSTVKVHRSTMSCFICVKPCSLGKFIDWFRGRSCLVFHGGYHDVIYVFKSGVILPVPLQPWAKVIGMGKSCYLAVQCLFSCIKRCVMKEHHFSLSFQEIFLCDFPPDLRSFKAHHLMWHHKKRPMSSEMFP